MFGVLAEVFVGEELLEILLGEVGQFALHPQLH